MRWTDVVTDPTRRLQGLVLALGIGFGIAAVLLMVAISPLVGFAALFALLLGAAMLVNPLVGMVTVIAVAYLLPFAVIPLPIGGVKLTFLDASLTVVLLVWVLRTLTKPEVPLVTSPLDGFVLVFMGLALVSFIVGINSVTNEVFRFFLKSINSILFFFSVTNVIRQRYHLEGILRALIGAGFGASLIALVLYVLEPSTTERLLASLRVLGYPSGPGLLRYIAGTDTLRAIGTSIDPNVLGGMLLLVLPLALSQLFAKEPLLQRRWLVPILVALVLALLLTYSRSSWIGAVGAALFLGMIRYRRLWVVFVLFLVVLYFAPTGEMVLERVQSGIEAQDRAAQMRLGEYKDALRLISLYPWFGVGFGAAPSIDLYIATSSVYLLIAEEMGLIGLSAFAAIIIALFVVTARGWVGAADPQLQSIQAGALAAVVGALIAGIFDHYFFNLHFPHTVALFWLFVGLTVVTTRLKVGRGAGAHL